MFILLWRKYLETCIIGIIRKNNLVGGILLKKPWYKRWKVWGGTFAVIVVIGMFSPEELPEPEVAAEVEKPKEVAKAPVVAVKSAEEIAKEAEDAKRIAEIAKENEAKAAEAAAADAKAKAEAAATKKADAAKAAESVRGALKGLVELSGGVVVDIKPSPYGDGSFETSWVIVSDAWYDSAEHEKERFAETIGNAVKLATNGEAKLVHFYDAYDKELASEKVFGGYKIKR